MTPILYRDRQIDLTDPLFVRLINCATDEDRAKFVWRFGPDDDIARPREFADLLRRSAESILSPDLPERIKRLQIMFGLEADTLQTVNSTFLFNVLVEPRLAKLEDGSVQFVMEAPNLRDFLALELASAFQAGARAKRCEHCNKLFLHGPLTGRRSHAKYCADKCRVAAMRARNASQGDEA